MTTLHEKLYEIAKLKSGVKRLTLTDYRNYKSLRLNTEIAPIIITGENGSGKTNILEAVSFLTPGRGLRSSKLSDIKRIRSTEEIDDFNTENAWSVAADILKNSDENSIDDAGQHNT